MKIYILNDNRNEKECFMYEHGLSLYIETKFGNILFDAGQSDFFIKNAEKLGLNLVNTDVVVLSHGDYDHGNGLKFLNLGKKIRLVAHQDVFLNRISKRTGKYGGLNQTKLDLMKKFDLKLSIKPVKILENIYFLGEIEKTLDFDTGEFPMINDNGEEYKHLDDSGIVIISSEGLIVISGCAHSGICNTIEYAKKITGKSNVLAVIGGFHLKNVDDKTLKTIDYFKSNNIKQIFLAHCTSDAVCDEFNLQLKNQTIVVKVGDVYYFPD